MLKNKALKIVLFIASICLAILALSTILMPFFSVAIYEEKPLSIIGYLALFGGKITRDSGFIHYEVDLNINYYLIFVFQAILLSLISCAFSFKNRGNNLVSLVILTISLVGICLSKLFLLLGNESLVSNGTNLSVGFFVSLFSLILAIGCQIVLFLINKKQLPEGK